MTQTRHMTEVGPTRPGRLLTINQACQILGICRTTFRKIRSTGAIPEIPLTGDCVRFLEEDIHAYVRKMRNSALNVL